MSCALWARVLSLAAIAAILLSLAMPLAAQEPAPPAVPPAAAAAAAAADPLALAMPAAPVMLKALKDVPVDPARVARLGAKQYKLWVEKPIKRHQRRAVVTEMTRKSAGMIEVNTSAGPERLIFRDTWWDLTGKVKPVDTEIIYPADSILAPRRLAIDLPGQRSTTDLSRGRYMLGWRGYKRTGEWPADTLTLPALLRLGTILPHDPGIGYTFSNFTPIPEINIQENADPIVCVGPSVCKVLGRKIPCTKFTWGDVKLWYRDCDGALISLRRPGYVTLDLAADLHKVPECCADHVVPKDPLVPVPMPLPGVPAPPREDRPAP